MAKQKPLSPVAEKVLEVITASKEPLTLEDIKAIVPEANSGHLTALKNRKLIGSELIEKEVVRTVKTKVNKYTAVETETEVETEAE